MIYPSADKLEEWGNKYALVTLAAKRAKQLKSGAPPLINTDSRNPLTIALMEIAEGKIDTVFADTDAMPVAAMEPEIAQLLAIPEEFREDSEEETDVAEAILASDADEDIIEADEDAETLEEWEEDEEEDEAALDADTDAEVEVAPVDELAAPDEAKPKRGRRKAKAEVEEAPIGLDVVDDDVDAEDDSRDDDAWEE